MKILEMFLNLDSEDSNGVYGISMVSDPAMESNYVLLSTEDIKLKVLDNEKHIVSGVVLIPNKLIPRIDKKTGELYQIFFSADTIEKTSQQFLKDFNQKSITVEHMLNVDNVTVVESWIKSDAKFDKSEFLGIDAPIGSWFMTLKVEDMELWDQLLKTGLLNGFSIEGKFEPKEINKQELELTNMEKQEEKSVIKMLRELLLGKDVILDNHEPMVDEVVEEVVEEVVKETVTYELTKEEAELIENFRKVVEEVVAVIAEVPVEEVAPVVEEVQASKYDISEIVKQVKAELEPQLIPHTDVSLSVKKETPKFNYKLTTKDRIKEALKNK